LRFKVNYKVLKELLEIRERLDRLLEDYSRAIQPKSKKDKIELHIDVFCYCLEIDKNRIGWKGQKTDIANARKMITASLYKPEYITFSMIGKRLGGRDHSSIMYLLDAHKNHMIADQEYREKYLSIIEKLKS